jgi:ABC-2 type transport system permease protein
VSLETQQLWLLELLPVPRIATLAVKLLFSLLVTTLAGVGVMGLAVVALDLPREWAQLQYAACVGICIGLSGLAVGLGARFPVTGQRNPARIAAGFGGTLNLIASMGLVAIELATLAVFGVRGADPTGLHVIEVHAATLLTVVLPLIGCGVALASFWAGARHFERLEC